MPRVLITDDDNPVKLSTFIVRDDKLYNM